MFINKRMDKENVHMYHEITQLQKKHEVMPFAATWMQQEMIMLSEVGQKEKDYDFGLGWMG